MNAPRLQRFLRPSAERLEDRTVPAIFDVTTTADSGAGSLRAAINSANTTFGLDTIRFLIGTGVQTIQVGDTNLPTLTDPVILDGSTQPGFMGTPLVEIDFNDTRGLILGNGTDMSTVRGLAFL